MKGSKPSEKNGPGIIVRIIVMKKVFSGLFILSLLTGCSGKADSRFVPGLPWRLHSS